MRSLRWSLLVVVAVCLAAAPAGARVGPGDAAATHAYLKAKLGEERAAMSLYPRMVQAMEALAATVKAECPGVLAGAPLHTKEHVVERATLDITVELLIAVFGAAERVEHPVLARFAGRVRHLRWSDAGLTRFLHSLALEQAEQSAIAPPELCADLKVWVASGYTAVSPGTKRFLHRVDVVSSITKIESEPDEPPTLDMDELIADRLRPYENHADRLLARELPRRETKTSSPALKPLWEAAGKVYAALETPVAAT